MGGEEEKWKKNGETQKRRGGASQPWEWEAKKPKNEKNEKREKREERGEGDKGVWVRKREWVG